VQLLLTRSLGRSPEVGERSFGGHFRGWTINGIGVRAKGRDF